MVDGEGGWTSQRACSKLFCSGSLSAEGGRGPMGRAGAASSEELYILMDKVERKELGSRCTLRMPRNKQVPLRCAHTGTDNPQQLIPRTVRSGSLPHALTRLHNNP